MTTAHYWSNYSAGFKMWGLGQMSLKLTNSIIERSKNCIPTNLLDTRGKRQCSFPHDWVLLVKARSSHVLVMHAVIKTPSATLLKLLFLQYNQLSRFTCNSVWMSVYCWYHNAGNVIMCTVNANEWYKQVYYPMQEWNVHVCGKIALYRGANNGKARVRV